MTKKLIIIFLLILTFSPLSSAKLERDRSAVEVTGVIGSTVSMWADLIYNEDYAFYLNDAIDNEKADYLINSSNHGYQIATWGIVTNLENTTVKITHDKLMSITDNSYSGIEYKLFVDYQDPDDSTSKSRTFCYSEEGEYAQKTFSQTYNVDVAMTSFKNMGLYVQLDVDSLSDIEDAPSGEYISTITLTTSAQ